MTQGIFVNAKMQILADYWKAMITSNLQPYFGRVPPRRDRAVTLSRQIGQRAEVSGRTPNLRFPHFRNSTFQLLHLFRAGYLPHSIPVFAIETRQAMLPASFIDESS
jgi:hypothetical protein